ncbi:hypothetical protein [Kitasatospora sp. NPDC085464]|uniref:hypothetical protein n=1 Tax=Kitasatospora sp. NPDC085464 TaxID=3364063 RepID=UPI0037CC293F
MPSRIPWRRRAGLAGFAGLVLTVGLALTGCDPSAADATSTASATPSVAAAPTSPAPTTPAPVAPPTTPAAPAPATTPSEQPAAPAASQPAAPKAPQPKVTTAQPPADPQPEHTAAAAGGGCEIRSAAGNCYEAGQFCRNADLGKSTHDASGREISCRMVSGKPHWQA